MLRARRLGSLAFLFYLLIFVSKSDGYVILEPTWASNIAPALNSIQGIQLSPDLHTWPRSNEDIMDLRLFSIRDILNFVLLSEHLNKGTGAKESESDENLQGGKKKEPKKPTPEDVIKSLVGNG